MYWTSKSFYTMNLLILAVLICCVCGMVAFCYALFHPLRNASLLEVSELTVQILPPTNHDKLFLLEKDFCIRFEDTEGAHEIHVPKGFITNFATVPSILWWIVAPLDICYASIVHDYLYSISGHLRFGYSRKKADEVMRSIIARTHSRLLANICYVATRAFGSKEFLIE